MPVIDVNGLSMGYELRGSGDPIVLVAGTGYAGATWAPTLVEPLATHHTVLTFDHRGTGVTPPTRERFSTRLFAEDAIALMDALRLPAAHVVGHSMGGRVAQWMTLDHPDRVRSLVLAATGPGQWDGGTPVQRGIPLHTALAMIEHGYEGYMREHIRDTFFTPEFAEAHPEVVGWLVTAFWDSRPTLESYLRHIVARQEHQTADRLADISRPSLVLIGDRDRHQGGTGVHWEQSQALLKAVPGAVIEVIPDASHGYFWQAPELSARILLDWAAAH